jgi:hypothetical protein
MRTRALVQFRSPARPCWLALPTRRHRAGGALISAIRPVYRDAEELLTERDVEPAPVREPPGAGTQRIEGGGAIEASRALVVLSARPLDQRIDRLQPVTGRTGRQQLLTAASKQVRKRVHRCGRDGDARRPQVLLGLAAHPGDRLEPGAPFGGQRWWRRGGRRQAGRRRSGRTGPGCGRRRGRLAAAPADGQGEHDAHGQAVRGTATAGAWAQLPAIVWMAACPRPFQRAAPHRPRQIDRTDSNAPVQQAPWRKLPKIGSLPTAR